MFQNFQNCIVEIPFFVSVNRAFLQYRFSLRFANQQLLLLLAINPFGYFFLSALYGSVFLSVGALNIKTTKI